MLESNDTKTTFEPAIAAPFPSYTVTLIGAGWPVLSRITSPMMTDGDGRCTREIDAAPDGDVVSTHATRIAVPRTMDTTRRLRRIVGVAAVRVTPAAPAAERSARRRRETRDRPARE